MYGTLEIGEVPRLDFVTRPIPKPIKSNPTRKIVYLTSLFIILYFSLKNIGSLIVSYTTIILVLLIIIVNNY